MIIELVVDNRVFLLGLDELYRSHMKSHERGELLKCARGVAEALNVGPADVPIEGYYAEEEKLTEYFRLLRALQTVNKGIAQPVRSMPEFKRLLEVTSSPLYGEPQDGDGLLPVGQDSMTRAMFDTFPDWTIAGLVKAARKAALEHDDYSLVGLSARARDALVLASLRESVVLYEVQGTLSAEIGAEPPKVVFTWMVDEDLARQAARLIDTFHALFGERIPSPEPDHAAAYWQAHRRNKLVGRCVRLGYDPRTSPPRYYHWAIGKPGYRRPVVRDFWSAEIWTTERYSKCLRVGGRVP